MITTGIAASTQWVEARDAARQPEPTHKEELSRPNVSGAEVEKSRRRGCSLHHVHPGLVTDCICIFTPNTFCLKVLVFTFK